MEPVLVPDGAGNRLKAGLDQRGPSLPPLPGEGGGGGWCGAGSVCRNSRQRLFAWPVDSGLTRRAPIPAFPRKGKESIGKRQMCDQPTIAFDGEGVNLQRAVARYLFAVIGIFFFGCGILWALLDRERQFLHDRLAGTRIVKLG